MTPNTQTTTQAAKVQTIRARLLDKLADAEFHSGESLAKTFDLSRSAISNHIKALNDLGLDIFSVKGRGYKLVSSVELLCHDKIVSNLSAKQSTTSELVRVENVVTSTNDVIKTTLQQTPSVQSGYCCMAQAQSAGRGRRGRTWVSPYASSLYFSMLWRFANGYSSMAGLSLMIGIVVHETLSALGVQNCKLKWPNDIYCDEKKLAGILIEVEGQIDAGTDAIIGIGINVNLPHNVKGIDQAFTDLTSVAGSHISKNKLAALLIQNLWQALPIFESQGLKPYVVKWQALDLYYLKDVKLLIGDMTIVGVGQGIDSNGALLLLTDGEVRAFHGGEISVRPG